MQVNENNYADLYYAMDTDPDYDVLVWMQRQQVMLQSLCGDTWAQKLLTEVDAMLEDLHVIHNVQHG